MQALLSSDVTVKGLTLFLLTPAQVEFLLHSLEQAARDIGFDMTLDKTDEICFYGNGTVSSLNDKPLKLLDEFIYLGSNISSTEREIDIHKLLLIGYRPYGNSISLLKIKWEDIKSI